MTIDIKNVNHNQYVLTVGEEGKLLSVVYLSRADISLLRHTAAKAMIEESRLMSQRFDVELEFSESGYTVDWISGLTMNVRRIDGGELTADDYTKINEINQKFVSAMKGERKDAEPTESD